MPYNSFTLCCRSSIADPVNKTPAIIPRIEPSEHRPAWKLQLANAVKSADELLGLLKIDPAQMKSPTIASHFPLRVPRGFIKRMNPGDASDPLLLQVLPLELETREQPGYSLDPLEEQNCMASPGLLQKYRGRALLTVTGACGIHCRYCFRRHFPYADANPVAGQLDQSITWLQQQPDIKEVILSGGDPLSLDDRLLDALATRLDSLPQLRTLRIHTRMPVVLPERIDDALLEWIGDLRTRVVMVIHSNHPNEINSAVVDAMQRLRQVGVTLLNQSVLLRGINDSAASLIDLSETLFTAGVLPYYLHQMDKVQGAAHFEVEDSKALRLHAEIHAALPGYLVPRLVREQPGAPGKTAL